MKTKLKKYRALFFAVLLVNTEEMNGQGTPVNMSWIPPGNFVMGNTFSEGLPEELPTHTVYVSGFFMDKYEVTKALWDEVYQWAIANNYSFDNPGVGKAANHPIHSVRWYDVVKWCNARSQKEGKTPAYYMDAGLTVVYKTGQVAPYVNWNSGFRLPTEAEWEKAARGGASSGHRFPWSDADTITHSRANYYSATRDVYDVSPTRGYHPTFNDIVYPYNSPVGYFAANGYGLYDMAGNVWEWCWDWYDKYSSDSQTDPHGPASGSIRVFRGGAWDNGAFGCRVVVRAHSIYPVDADFRLGFRSVLPSTSTWRQAIETQPVQPIYGDYPTKELGKDSLVLVTHGWIRPAQSVDSSIAWVNSILDSIVQYLTANSLISWQVCGYKWVDGAKKFFPSDALNNAKQEGQVLGDHIAKQGWAHVHLIAHSAGAGLIQAVSEKIKALSPSTTVHCTFLDPFVGSDYAGVSNYGSGADWAENYFSRDSETIISGPVTESLLNHAYNVDVTPLDPNKHVGTKFRSSVTGEMEPCIKTFTSHGWPIDFYMNTITGSGVTSDYAGFGFALGKEGGDWSPTLAIYMPGNDPAHILGTPDSVCLTEVKITPPAWVDTLIDFTQSPTIQSDTGTIQKWLDALKLSSGSLVWLAMVVSNTNPVNVVSFDAKFTSVDGAQGLLSVLWDEQIIGLIDERVVNTNHYMFQFPNATANSSHILGFRLDPFTNIQSVVTVTNVVLNQVGVSQPFSLSLAGSTANGALVYELVGEAGFEYRIQSSTNLVNWTDIITLVNTNGAVRFFDQDSTNYPTIFYRAVAPY